MIMSCQWHNFHTTEFETFMTYAYDVKILNTDNGIRKQQVQLDNGNAILQYCQCTYMDVSDKVL